MFDTTGEFDGSGRALAVETLRVTGPEATEAVRAAPDGAPELVWQGIFRGWSGYAKASREVMLRLANTFRVSAVPIFEPPGADPYQQARVDTHRRIAVSDSAPLVRMFGPDPVEEDGRHRIVWTMMETQSLHPDMRARMEASYHEVWTPTHWNAEVFRRAGLSLPVRVMPLGVCPTVYRPGPRRPLPECTLLSTAQAGRRARPAGFIFITVCLPSFRKGMDLLIPAFQDAFGDDPSAALVVAVTHGADHACPQLAPDPSARAPVWLLDGEYTEHQMAGLYRGSDAYVSASRGEGWNLPMMEAAACGLPVVAPRNTAHLDLLEDATAFLFDCEGAAPWPGAEAVSRWYEGMDFAVFGQRSREQLAARMREVRAGPETRRVAARFSNRVRTRWTWDNAARLVAERLLELTA